MKKYLRNRKLDSITCHWCGESCMKPVSEIKRAKDKDKNLFCSRRCCVLYGNKIQTLNNTRKSNIHNLKVLKMDEYSSFRAFIRKIKRRYIGFDLTLEDLKNQFDNQNGICPYSGVQLILKNHKSDKTVSLYQASLDRIDSSKGYSKGNIEFVALPINYMKNSFTKDQVKKFLNELISNSKNI